MGLNLHFQVLKGKLRDDAFVDILWRNVVNDECIAMSSELNEYRFHLPVVPEEFWRISITLVGKESNIAENLKTYILTLLHWYTNKNLIPDLVYTNEAMVLACEFYFKLLLVLSYDEYFIEPIYLNCLNVIKNTVNDIDSVNVTLSAMKTLRVFLQKNVLQPHVLKFTLAELCNIVKALPLRVYTSFSLESNTQDICHEALMCLKVLALGESNVKRRVLVYKYLLSGVKRLDEAPFQATANVRIQHNFRNVLVDLNPILSQNNYEIFRHAITQTLVTDCEDFNEFVNVMIHLGADFFKSYADYAFKMGIAKTIRNKANVVKLYASIFANLPVQWYKKEKLEVLLQCLLKNCIINCVNEVVRTDEVALDVLANAAQLHKPVIREQLRYLYNTRESTVSAEISFPMFMKIFDRQWKNRKRNKNIIIIVINLLILSESVYVMEYCKFLDLINNVTTPAELKILIPMLIELYTSMLQKRESAIAVKILEIIHSMAMNNAATSAEYVKTLHSMLVNPDNFADLGTYSDHFITTILSEQFDQQKFLEKCHSLGLLRTRDIEPLITKFPSIGKGSLTLIAAVFQYTVKRSCIIEIINRVLKHPNLVTNTEKASYVFHVINIGLAKGVGNFQQLEAQDKQSIVALKRLLRDKLSEFLISSKCVANCLELIVTITKLTRDDDDINSIIEATDERLEETLKLFPKVDTAIPIIYASELCLVTGYKPHRFNIQRLVDILDKYKNITGPLQKDHYDAVHCLMLYVRYALKEQRNAERAYQYVNNFLKFGNDTMNLIALDLMFDLCSLVLQQYEDFIEHIFKGIRSDSFPIKRNCFQFIDRLMRDDYLKLTDEQFCQLMCHLGDVRDGTGNFLEKLLATNFLVSNHSVIAKYFITMMVYVNLYVKHPSFPMEKDILNTMKMITTPSLCKWKIYSFLFRALPIKTQFYMVLEICKNIFDLFVTCELKCHDGFWDLIRDAIMVFKIMTCKEFLGAKYIDFYKEQVDQINKTIFSKKALTKDQRFPEYTLEIKCTTKSLLNLLLFTDNEQTIGQYKAKLFEAIILWTAYLMIDIASICISEGKEGANIMNSYKKLVAFYEKQEAALYTSDILLEEP